MRTTVFSVVFTSGMLAASTSVLGQGVEQGGETALLASTWSSFARALPSGSRVRVVLKDGRTLRGSLVAASESSMVLKPPGRLPEADVTIQTDTINSLGRDGGNPRDLIPTPGERVRVVTRDSRAPLIGTLTSIDQGNLSMLLEGRRGLVRIEGSRLDSLQISSGPKSLGRRLARGASLGLATGMACGIAYSLIASPCLEGGGRCGGRDPGQIMAVGLMLGTGLSVFTVPLGTVIGAAGTSERWKKVDRPQLALTLVPQKQGAALALRLRF